MINPRIPFALIACLAVDAGCRGSCGGEGGKPIVTAPVTGIAQELPRHLDPLPPPPPITVTPEPSSGAFRVVVARPRGDFRGAEVRPTITFSKPVKSLSAIEEPGKEAPVARIEPPLEGEWKWLGSASAEFVPRDPVPYSTAFKVTVPRGLRALDGSTLQEDYAFEFNTPRVELQEASPANGYRWLKPDDTIKLLFNQPVADTELASALAFRVGSDPTPWKAQVMARVSIEEERRQRAEKVRQEGGSSPPEGSRRAAVNRQVRYTIVPERPFPAGTQVTLTIASSLHGEQGPLPMGREAALSWRTYGPLKLVGARMCESGESCPRGPLVITLTNPVDVESLKGKVQVSPPVAIDWDHVHAWAAPPWAGAGVRDPYVELPGRFRPGTGYEVKIASGVQDVFKQVAEAPLSARVGTSDLQPALRIGGPLALIEASSGPRLPIEVANLQTLEEQLWRLSLPEAAAQLSVPVYSNERKLSRAPDVSDSVALPYERNQARVHGVDLSRVLAGGKGLALVVLNSPELGSDRPKSGFQTLVQVTDLAVHLKTGPKSSLGWVTRLSTGAPVAGANVSLYDAGGRVLWTGTSDAAGFASIPGASELKLPEAKNPWERPFLMAAATVGDDTSVTADTWNEGFEPYLFDGVESGWEGTRPESSGFLFTDRGIYRPGDKVYIKGVVRFRRLGELQMPEPGSTLSLSVSNSRGEKTKLPPVKVSKYGTFDAAAEIPKDAPTGYFSVAAEGDAPGGRISFSESFRVEEYRAPQFKVDVRPAAPSLIAGEKLRAQVLARYQFGGTMSNAQVKWSAVRETSSFTPEGFSGFTFEQETWWWDDRRPRPTGGFFASGEGLVGAQGLYELEAGEVQAPAEKTWRYEVEAEVTDVNRQAVAGRASVTVHPAAWYVGLRGPTGFPEVGKEVAVEAVAVDTGGKRAPGRKLEVAIAHRTWKSVRQKDAGGGFSTVSEPVEEPVQTCALTSADDPVACRFKPAAPGLYIVRATIEDDQKRKHASSLGLYAVGPGFVAWQRDDTNRLQLTADKTTYGVGDVARVLIKSPFPEAKGLLTIEREGVLERRMLELKGSVVTVEVPITGQMVPNVYASVLLLRPRVAVDGKDSGEDPGRPQVSVGYVKLSVEKKTKRLSVAVAADRPEYRPGQEVTASLEVKDSAGRGVPAEVTVFAVDDAVLRLTSYKTPDPIASIFPDRPDSVLLGEPLIHLVRRRSYGEKGEDPGGGGGESGEGKGFRSNFKVTALFAPTVETGPDGRAQVKFKLPDNLTTFRIMAVAVTAGDRFGSGDTELKVNKPLLALPALPRFARVGDAFEAGVVVHSYGEGQGEVTVSAEVQGAKAAGPVQVKVVVTPTSPREVRFPFTADVPGTATFRFRVQRGADEDGVEEKIPVELPMAPEVVATYGDTTDQRVEAVSPPAGVRPGLGGLEVSMASTALGNFQEGMRQLVDYPYGCLEQQASRLVPFVALRELSGQFGIPWPSPDQQKQDALRAVNGLLRAYLFDPLDVTELKEPDQVIGATVRSILKLQDPDGSFRYWSDSTCSSSWASAYATLALTRARQVGFEVEPEKLAHAQAYLGQVVGGSCHPCERECPLETRTLAAYVLARAGRPRPSVYGELFKGREQLSLFSRALLADAMFVGGGDRTQARTLLDEIMNHAQESPRGVHFEETQDKTYAALWQSDTRTTGAVLQTLVDIAPDHPYVSKIAHALTGARQQDGRWRSTQEAAFSLMGLVEVVRVKERDVPDFTARMTFGGQTLAQETFKGRSLEVREKTIPIDEVAKAAGSGQQLVVKKEGKGVLYYSARLEYVPKELPMTPLDRGLYVQRWFEPYSGGGQTTKFYAGDLVRVRLRVGTSQERRWAAFEVPLPAGLEPVDTSLATTARQPRAPHEEAREGYEYENAGDQESGTAAEGQEEASPWAYAFYSPFNHVERRDSKVVLFADELPPGVHVASFVARATTPGRFLLKPAHGQLMYEPEVFGRSEGGTMEIVLPSQVSSR